MQRVRHLPEATKLCPHSMPWSFTRQLLSSSWHILPSSEQEGQWTGETAIHPQRVRGAVSVSAALDAKSVLIERKITFVWTKRKEKTFGDWISEPPCLPLSPLRRLKWFVCEGLWPREASNSGEGKHLEFRGTVGLDDQCKTMQMFQIMRSLMMTRKCPQQPTGWFLLYSPFFFSLV